MMPDLIGRKALLAEINRTIEIMEKRKDRISVRNVIVCVKNAPTVDAVPVVRCKHCTCFQQEDGVCVLWDGFVGGDDFCSHGERR